MGLLNNKNKKHNTNPQYVPNEVEKYRVLFDNASDLIAVIDRKGNFIELNKKFEQESLYSKNEMLGKNALTSGIVTKKSALKLAPLLPKIIQGKPIQIIEIDGVTKNGDIVPYELRAVPLFNKGKVVAVQAILRNITQRKQHEKKYQDLFNSIYDALLLVDINGNIIDCNPAFTEIFGYSLKEIRGKKTSCIYHDEHQFEEMEKKIRENVHHSDLVFTIDYRKKTGEVFPTETKVFFLKDHDNTIYGFIGLIRDISKQIQAEKEREHHLKEMNLITDMVVNTSRMQDIDALCQYVGDTIHSLNKNTFVSVSLYDPDVDGIRIRALCGFESVPESLLPIFKEFSVEKVLPCDQIQKDSQLYQSGNLRQIPNGIYEIMADTISKEKSHEIEKLLGIGSVYRVGLSLKNKPFGSISILLKHNEKIQYKSAIETIASHFSVIIHQKQAEERFKKAHEELRKLNQTLEKKVDERTSEICRLLKQKDEFINQLGHDLKNPLGPFIQLLPILKKNACSRQDEDIVNVLERNARYMQNLVKKTIDLAKLNSTKTKFDFKDHSLYDIVNEVISVNRAFFDNHTVVVNNNVTSDCMVHVDEFHIEEVFTNLFNNAVKYTTGEGRITIDTTIENDVVLVSVTDTGIGISADQIQYLFDEYYKADPSRHDFDSSGLGLPICKRIIEKHGGKIWVESPGIGKGSTVYFTLPIPDNKT